jgi:hypothetical protein
MATERQQRDGVNGGSAASKLKVTDLKGCAGERAGIRTKQSKYKSAQREKKEIQREVPLDEDLIRYTRSSYYEN